MAEAEELMMHEEEMEADFFEHEPSKAEKAEMRKESKTPSEWLRLLCRDWALENADIVDTTDEKLGAYKPYLKGQLTSQLLCRLSLAMDKKDNEVEGAVSSSIDFWQILGIDDEFDKSYIVAQVEKFCSIYGIRGGYVDEDALKENNALGTPLPVDSAAVTAAAGIAVSQNGVVALPSFLGTGLDPQAAAAVAAAAVAAADVTDAAEKSPDSEEVDKAHRMANDAEKALDSERKHVVKKEQRRLSQERRELKQREREAANVKKAADRAAREATREERRQKKLLLRQQREKFAQEQKEAALRRAAELVQSNRVPIEITRGAAAAQAAANAAVAAVGGPVAPPEIPSSKKQRSCIVVSTASDLQQIVTHAKNLWTKYNAIAKEHNQKVNWIVVAKELGIHVKVREKYARMHSRAVQRGFDFDKCGHFKIKDYPQIFLEPTAAEQKAKMPPPPPDVRTTVLINGHGAAHAVVPHHHHHHQMPVHAPMPTAIPPSVQATVHAAVQATHRATVAAAAAITTTPSTVLASSPEHSDTPTESLPEVSNSVSDHHSADSLPLGEDDPQDDVVGTPSAAVIAAAADAAAEVVPDVAAVEAAVDAVVKVEDVHAVMAPDPVVDAPATLEDGKDEIPDGV